jgi:small GTP-binding protein
MKKFKIVLLGEGRVGKSSIGVRYTQNTFDPERAPTVQAAFYARKIETNHGTMELNLWDTAGQEEYHALAPIYYKGAHAALLVYSVVNETSFERMCHWHKELNQILGNTVKIFVVANKIDLPGRQIGSARGVQFATSIGSNHFEVSAKTGEGLDLLFRCVGDALAKDADATKQVGPKRPIKGKGSLLVLGEENEDKADGDGCC